MLLKSPKRKKRKKYENQIKIKINEKGFKYASFKRLGSYRNALTGEKLITDISLPLSLCVCLFPSLGLSVFVSHCVFNDCVNYLAWGFSLLTFEFYGISVEKRVKSSQVDK